MTIAEVSKKYDISADTLRYYERIGLIPPVHRTAGGIRDYMRCAWLTIEALIEYVSLAQQGESTVDARKELLIEQRRLLQERIEEMQSTLQRLDKKIDRYEHWVYCSDYRLGNTDTCEGKG